MRYGIEIDGRLFEVAPKDKLNDRLGVIRWSYPQAIPVKIYKNGDRKEIQL